MQNLETGPTQPMSKNALKLLELIRNYIDAGNGYFLTIGAGPALLDADQEKVRGYLHELLDNGLIDQAPGMGFIAVNITKTGRELLEKKVGHENSNPTARNATERFVDATAGRALVWLLGLHRLG